MKGREEVEVEELLQAAQDEALLNLTIHSHLPSTHSPSNYPLHPDLHRRFQSLKSKPKSSLSSSSAATSAAPVAGDRSGQREQDKDQDLLARFQALKASISTSASDPTTSHGIPPPLRHHPSDDDDDDDEVNEDDEVDKVIQWAVDAARLDPSPLAGDDDDSEEEEEEKVAGESRKETKKHR